MEEIAPTVFRTVYEYSGPPMTSYLLPGIAFFFGLVSLVMLVATWSSGKGTRLVWVGLFFLSVGLTAAASWRIFKTHGPVVKAIGERQIREITGPVEDFVPESIEGAQHESFTVKEVRFEYSDSQQTGGFNNSSTQGGPIGPGITVRLTYFHHPGLNQNIIVKLQVPE
ncbi:MAG: hypothetical protein WC314_17735 [Vulcanimicrobiota bacterium]